MGYYHDFLKVVPQLKIIADQGEKEIIKKKANYTVYNPFNYGIECYIEYLKKYFINRWPEFVVIGTNPGIDGAVQTCIPFTDVYNCINKLNVDVINLIKPYYNVSPSNYVTKSKEPSSRLFYEAIECSKIKNSFYSQVLLVNSFPLGVTQSISNTKNGSVSINNVRITDFKNELGKKVKDISEENLMLILTNIRNCKLISLGKFSKKRLDKLNYKSYYCIHPSPTALRTQGITDEAWKKKFINYF